MPLDKILRRVIVLVISFLLFVTVTVLRFFNPEWIAMLNIYFFCYGLSGFVIASIWAGESWRWGLWLVACLWGLLVASLLFSDFYGLDILKNIVPLCVATIAACFGSYLGASLNLRKRFSK